MIVTEDRDAALRHAASCRRVLVEEYLDGPEVSLFALSDGTSVLPFEPAQDFKRVGDGDVGPNTGGMGAYTPLPWAPPGLTEQVVRTVIQPTIDELRRRGTPFVGLLYAGLALTSRGVRVVEFNARFGDPETQPLLTRLKTPLGGALYAAATGALVDHPPLEWGSGAAVGVVIAATATRTLPARATRSPVLRPRVSSTPALRWTRPVDSSAQAAASSPSSGRATRSPKPGTRPTPSLR